MKHALKITAILLMMFVLTQLIGLVTVNYYNQDGTQLPYGMDAPETSENIAGNMSLLFSLIISFVIAIIIFFILMNIKSVWFMRGWFFIVVTLALGITINVVTSGFLDSTAAIILASSIALILAFFKIFQRNILIHNSTELLIYPGIAAVFVPILNMWTLAILLIIISIYDIWAVWHSGIMQKMAKFQMDKLRVFSGFFVPYASKTVRAKIKALKLKYKDSKEIPESVIKKKGIKVNLAILGGGDVIFPIIAAGVFLKTFESISAALIVTLFATIALALLFVFAKKKKFYPAMPFISTGIFAGMLVAWLMLKFVF